MKLSITIGLVFLVAGLVSGPDKSAADFPKNEETNKVIEMLAGSWKLQSIADEKRNQSTTSKRNKKSKTKAATAADTDMSRNAMQMLEFDADGRYKVNNSTTAIDSGSYRINEQHSVLYMESDADDITPTEWDISVTKKRLTMVGRSGDADARYKYMYAKEKEEVSTN